MAFVAFVAGVAVVTVVAESEELTKPDGFIWLCLALYVFVWLSMALLGYISLTHSAGWLTWLADLAG